MIFKESYTLLYNKGLNGLAPRRGIGRSVYHGRAVTEDGEGSTVKIPEALSGNTGASSGITTKATDGLVLCTVKAVAVGSSAVETAFVTSSVARICIIAVCGRGFDGFAAKIANGIAVNGSVMGSITLYSAFVTEFITRIGI